MPDRDMFTVIEFPLIVISEEDGRTSLANIWKHIFDLESVIERMNIEKKAYWDWHDETTAIIEKRKEESK